MPTYQYACTVCPERLEVVQRFTDDPLTECPECTGALRKVFSAVGVVFKGSGFYKTDSRGSSRSSAAGSSAAKTTESAESSSTSETTSAPASTSSSTDTPAAAAG